MKPIDKGTIKDSALYFHTASTQALKTYFYLLCTGHYQCSKDYIVNRNSYDSILLMYVKKGKGCMIDKGSPRFFSEGQAVLLDCYLPHTYQAIDHMEIVWIHFDGIAARNYYELIVNAAGNIIALKDPYWFEKEMMKIYTAFHQGKPVNEALIARDITKLLTALIISGHEYETNHGHADSIDEVLSYIRDNLNKNLTLSNLAAKVSLSPYYFTRVFKKETGFTPHEYLITARVNAAKFYLKASACPIKEICYNCGFTSESSFCTTFKRVTGVTPSAFRYDSNIN